MFIDTTYTYIPPYIHTNIYKSHTHRYTHTHKDIFIHTYTYICTYT